MLTIRKLECGAYRVHHLLTNYSDLMYETLNKALDLCRLRCNTNLKENNIKYWILLSICAVLGAYTHYFVAIAFVAMYIILFVSQILLNKENKKDSIKNWLISVVVGIIL